MQLLFILMVYAKECLEYPEYKRYKPFYVIESKIFMIIHVILTLLVHIPELFSYTTLYGQLMHSHA